MTYLVIYGVHRNCCICCEEDRQIEADSLEEAKEMAKKLSDQIEKEYAEREMKETNCNNPSDWWVSVEDIISENELSFENEKK